MPISCNSEGIKMSHIDNAVVNVLSGVGKIPDQLKETLTDCMLFGLPVIVKQLGNGPMQAGPPIGIMVSIPCQPLFEVGQHDMAKLNAFLQTFLSVNENRCNFCIQAIQEQENGRNEINISSNNLTEENVSGFIDVVNTKMGPFIKSLEMPEESPWAIYINVDADAEIIKEVTGFSLFSKDFYILDMNRQSWNKQPKPEEFPAS